MSLGPEAQREAVRPGRAPPIFLLTSNLTLRLAVPIFLGVSSSRLDPGETSAPFPAGESTHFLRMF